MYRDCFQNRRQTLGTILGTALQHGADDGSERKNLYKKEMLDIGKGVLLLTLAT